MFATVLPLLETVLVRFGTSALTVRHVLVLVVVLAVFEALIRLLEGAITRYFDADADDVDDKMPTQLRRAVRWPLSVVGLLAALRLAGLNPKIILDFFSLQLFVINATPVTPSALATFTILVLLTWWLSRLAQRAAVRAMRRRKVREEGTIAVTRRLLHYAVMMIGLGVALETVGIDLSVLFAAGAVFAVGIGFALQNIMENFVSGLLLLIEGAIRPSDVILFDGEMVTVRRMNIRTTVVETQDNEHIIVPNSMLAQSSVRNLSYETPLHRVRTTVGVAYDSDMRQVEEVLHQAALKHSDRVPEREPIVNLLNFGDSAVIWEVSVHTMQPANTPRARSELNKAIWWALKDANIVVAFPQLDVHLIARREAP